MSEDSPSICLDLVWFANLRGNLPNSILEVYAGSKRTKPTIVALLTAMVVIFMMLPPTPGAEATTKWPYGATARCKDGTYSYSAHRRGACSHHRGVAIWR